MINNSRKNKVLYFLCLYPAILYIVAFSIFPLIFATILTFFSGHGNDLQFSGFENYTKIANDLVFKNALGNTFLFALIIVPIGITLSLLIAFLLFKIRNKKAARVFTSFFYLPSITSPVVYSLFFKQIVYSDSFFSKILKIIFFYSAGNECFAKCNIGNFLHWFYMCLGMDRFFCYITLLFNPKP